VVLLFHPPGEPDNVEGNMLLLSETRCAVHASHPVYARPDEHALQSIYPNLDNRVEVWPNNGTSACP
jgi:hypothetical protein